MDNLKKPETIISGANAVGLIVISAYFYKTIGDLQNEINDLKRHLGNTITMVTELQKHSSLLPQIPPVIKKIQDIQDDTAKQQRRIMANIREQNDLCSNVVGYCEELNKNIVDIGGKSIDNDLDFDPVNNTNFKSNSRKINNTRNNSRRHNQRKIQFDDELDEFEDSQDEDNLYESEDNVQDIIKRAKTIHNRRTSKRQFVH